MLLARLQPYAHLRVFGRLYRALLRLWESEGAPVKTVLHGFNVLINRGNSYQLMLQGFPQFNAPLVELVHQIAKAKKRPLAFVDVGAATGDTVLLLKERCAGDVGQFICIEGDTEFHALLVENMRQFTDVEVIQCLLARQPMQIRSLIKHHKGTASATGGTMLEAVSLDSIASIQNAQIDILKIDVDGFDGEVLEGAAQMLKRWKPSVIFEWHPQLVLDAGNDPFRAFDTLSKAGYTRYAWFNNIGTFSHFSESCSRDLLKKQRDYFLAVNARAGAHVDVVALAPGNDLDDVALGVMEYARSVMS